MSLTIRLLSGCCRRAGLLQEAVTLGSAQLMPDDPVLQVRHRRTLCSLVHHCQCSRARVIAWDKPDPVHMSWFWLFKKHSL